MPEMSNYEMFTTVIMPLIKGMLQDWCIYKYFQNISSKYNSFLEFCIIYLPDLGFPDSKDNPPSLIVKVLSTERK